MGEFRTFQTEHEPWNFHWMRANGRNTLAPEFLLRQPLFHRTLQ